MGSCSFFIFNRLVVAYRWDDREPGFSDLRRPETGEHKGVELPQREGLVDISLAPSVKITQRFCANKALKANNSFY